MGTYEINTAKSLAVLMILLVTTAKVYVPFNSLQVNLTWIVIVKKQLSVIRIRAAASEISPRGSSWGSALIILGSWPRPVTLLRVFQALTSFWIILRSVI